MSGGARAGAGALGEVARVLLAVGLALLVAFAIVLATSDEPGRAFATFLTAPLSSSRTAGLWIDDVAKLTLAGLAFSLVFQARQFALGVQGQAYVGGLCAALIALSPLGTSALAIPLAMLAAMAAGAVWGWMPGIAKACFGASEIVSSLMLNYIAIRVVNWIVRAYLAPANSGQLASPKFPESAVLPALVEGTRLDLGIAIALLTAALVWFVLHRTVWGLKLRLTGHNPAFAEQAGIPASAVMVGAMAASGAIGGLLGAVLVQGQAFRRIAIDFDGNMAFEGILIAIVARERPALVPLVALAYGYLRQGAQLMGLRTDVPTEMLAVVQALVILLVASSFTPLGRRFWRALRLRRAVTA